MKNIIIIILIGLSIFGVACGSTTIATSKNSIGNMSNEEKEFTVSELSKYDGKNGNPAYVAVDGIVYDVTNAKGWRNGTHKNGITAGKDLSKTIKESPHGESVLKGLTIVGKLQ